MLLASGGGLVCVRLHFSEGRSRPLTAYELKARTLLLSFVIYRTPEHRRDVQANDFINSGKASKEYDAVFRIRHPCNVTDLRQPGGGEETERKDGVEQEAEEAEEMEEEVGQEGEEDEEGEAQEQAGGSNGKGKATTKKKLRISVYGKLKLACTEHRTKWFAAAPRRWRRSSRSN